MTKGCFRCRIYLRDFAPGGRSPRKSSDRIELASLRQVDCFSCEANCQLRTAPITEVLRSQGKMSVIAMLRQLTGLSTNSSFWFFVLVLDFREKRQHNPAHQSVSES